MAGPGPEPGGCHPYSHPSSPQTLPPVFLLGASAAARRSIGAPESGLPQPASDLIRRARFGGDMVSSAPCFSLYHHTLSFPAATTKGSSASSRSTSLGLPAGRCSGPTAVATDAAFLCDAAAVDKRRCECFDLHQDLVPFAKSWAWQKSVVTRRKGLAGRDADDSDTLVTLQHPPVYTLGTDSREEYLHFNVKDAPIEIHRIDRGGEVTYHGPGQLVMYPILNLRHHKMDLHWYLRSLEEVIIRALQYAFFIKASRIEGLTGVWVGDQKVAAIGIHVSRWIAYHGLALNVTTDLTPFQLIVPCGIKDRGVGSIKEILQKASSGRDIDEAVLMDLAYKSLIKEFAEVFQLSLDLRPDWNLQEN